MEPATSPGRKLPLVRGAKITNWGDARRPGRPYARRRHATPVSGTRGGLPVLAASDGGVRVDGEHPHQARLVHRGAGRGSTTSPSRVADPNYTLVDPGATIVAQPACTLFAGAGVCPVAGIIGFTVSGGDGADSITNTTSTPSTLSGGDGNDSLAGGSGNDILRGNKGVDTHAGGAGDDYIDARGDRGDIVTCGDGNDTVLGRRGRLDRGRLRGGRPGHRPAASTAHGAALRRTAGGPSRPRRDAQGLEPRRVRHRHARHARERRPAVRHPRSATTSSACRATTCLKGPRGRRLPLRRRRIRPHGGHAG